MPQDGKGSDTRSVSRRDVLKTTSGAIAAGVVAGTAAATEDGRVEVNVGFSSEVGAQAARDAAVNTKREFKFDAMTIEVPKEGVDALKNNPNIRYVEENGEMHALDDYMPYGIDRVDADVTNVGARRHVLRGLLREFERHCSELELPFHRRGGVSRRPYGTPTVRPHVDRDSFVGVGAREADHSGRRQRAAGRFNDGTS